MGPITMAESNSIYQAMDINHSGTITYDEFVSGLIRFNWDTSKVQTAKTFVFKFNSLFFLKKF